MKIVFIGGVEFSATALKSLLEIKANVVGICTNTSSAYNSDHYDLSIIGEEANIPVKITKNINDKDVYNWICNLQPDIILCLGWSQIIKIDLLRASKMGVVGYHPTLLPLNRGRHPIIWSLVLGLKETGSTFFFMDEGADSGDILSQRKVSINQSDNARTLYDKLSETAIDQIKGFIPLLENNQYRRISQDHSKATTWRKRTKKDGVIDWRMGANSINNLVRALTKPYVGAHFTFEGEEFKVWKTEIVENVSPHHEPGKILIINHNDMLIKCGEHAILIKDADWISNFKIGDYL